MRTEFDAELDGNAFWRKCGHLFQDCLGDWADAETASSKDCLAFATALPPEPNWSPRGVASSDFNEDDAFPVPKFNVALHADFSS